MMPKETTSNGIQVISSVTIAMSIGVVVVISNVIFVPIMWKEISLTWNQLEQQLRDVEAIRISIKKALDTLPVELTRQGRDLARQRLGDETMGPSTKPDSTRTRRRRTHRKREKVERHTSRKLTLRESELIGLSGSGGQCVCSLENKCPSGPPGPPGQNGEDGSSGRRGTPGMRGLHSMDVTAQHIFAGCVVCPAGPDGAPGERGQIGIPGPKGAPGLHGLPGRNGAPGSPGDIGPPGKSGKTGNAGEDGPRGMNGMVSEGLPGVKGQPGPRGPRGKRGDHGKNMNVEGDAGPQGRVGDEGVPGPRGPEGPPGAMGLPGIPGVSPDCDCKQIIREQTTQHHTSQSAQRHLRVHVLESQDQDAHLARVLSSLKAFKPADRSSEPSSEEEKLSPGEGSGEESEIATTTQPNDAEEGGPIQDFEEMKGKNEAADNGHESPTTASISLPEGQDGADVGFAPGMPVIELTSEKITSPTKAGTDPLPSTEPEQPSHEIYDVLVKVPTRTSKVNGGVHRARKLGRKPIRKPSGHNHFAQPHLNLSGNRNRKGVKKFKVDGDAGAVESESEKGSVSLERPPMLEVSGDNNSVVGPNSKKSRSRSGQFSKPAFDIGMVFAARERKRKRLLAQRGKLAHREQSKRLRNTAKNTTFSQRRPKNQINPNVDLIILPRPALTAFPVRNPTISIFNTLSSDIRTESSSSALKQPQRAFGPLTSQQRIRIPLETPSEGEIPVPDDVERRLYAVENELRSVVDVRRRSSDEEASSGHSEEGNERSSSQRSGESEVPSPPEIIPPLTIDIEKELESGMIGKIRESEYVLPMGLPSKIAMIYSTEPEEHKAGSDIIQEQNFDKNLVEGYVLPIDRLMDKQNSIVDLGFFAPWNTGKRRIHILLDRDSQNPSNGYVGITSQSHTESKKIPAKEHITFVDRAPYSPLARARAIISDIPSPEVGEVGEAKPSDNKRFHVSDLVSAKDRRGYLNTGTKLVRVSTGNVAKKQSIGGKKKTSLAASKRKFITPSSKKHSKIMPEYVGGKKGYEAIGKTQNSPDVWKIETMRLL